MSAKAKRQHSPCLALAVNMHFKHYFRRIFQHTRLPGVVRQEETQISCQIALLDRQRYASDNESVGACQSRQMRGKWPGTYIIVIIVLFRGQKAS
jgi:hypothetical protein